MIKVSKLENRQDTQTQIGGSMRVFLLTVLFAVATLFLHTVANGQDATTATTMVGQHAVEVVSGVVDKIPTSIPSGILLILTFLVEMVMRFYPTAQPRSILLMVGSIFNLVGKGFTKLSELLDMLVQNVKTK